MSWLLQKSLTHFFFWTADGRVVQDSPSQWIHYGFVPSLIAVTGNVSCITWLPDLSMFCTHDRHSCPHRSLRRCPCRRAGLWYGKRRVSPQVARLHYAAPALAWKWPQGPCRERGCHRGGPEVPGELWLGWELVESPDSWRRACRERAHVCFFQALARWIYVLTI